MVAVGYHPAPPDVGSLVSLRGRDWVVLPAPEPEVVGLRPLTGSNENAVGVFLPLEGSSLKTIKFDPPDPATAWDATGGRLLLDAARLALRDGAAPFRSLGRLAVTPRPYQFVPLIMALRLDPVRLLLADDVGVGKTVEAAMVARELLDRGLAKRLAVICPAHLCEQWETELREKFGIEAAVIQPARFARLERELPRQDLSVFRYHRHLIASIDYVKAGDHRQHFIDNAPDLVIVDEAHVAARPRSDGAAGGRTQHLRYSLLRDLARDRTRNLILVTATPHSGIEESFRSLLGLLDPRFDAVHDAFGQITALDRSALLPHVVQRRREDLAHWPGGDTPFPKRDPLEQQYVLSKGYHALFEAVLAYCRESVGETGLRAQQQRVRHWAAIALLRCVLSSPRAAVSVLAERAKRRGAPALEQRFASGEEADEVYRPQVMDLIDEEQAGDYVPSAPLEDADVLIGDRERRLLAGFLAQSRKLEGPVKDIKLGRTVEVVADLLRDGFRPIVFCRFIATAEYLEEWLPKALKQVSGADVRVVPVTGKVGDEQRRERIAELVSESGLRVLVATDCLSEGINLQAHFDAVVHYDLPWNPNRLEQREGRVDRFGQATPVVKSVLVYGADNQIDAVVLDVLIRKARQIRLDTGVAVPVPTDSEAVVQTVVASVLLNATGKPTTSQLGLGINQSATQLGLGLTGPDVSRLHTAWDAAAAKEKRERRFFAQHGIKPEEVATEILATDPVLGDADACRRFLQNAAQRFKGELRPTARPGVYDLYPGTLAEDLKRRGISGHPLRVVFDRLADPTLPALGRTHPVVTAFTEAVLGHALGPEPDTRFARCGAILTGSVQQRTAVLLLRLRYALREERGGDAFAEEVVVVAFERRDGRPAWLEPWEVARDLLDASGTPGGRMTQTERVEQIDWALSLIDSTSGWYRPIVDWRAGQLQASHDRLRRLVRGDKLTIRPQEPPDIFGCYVLVPAGGQR